MDSDHDDHDGDDTTRGEPPPVSRLDRGGTRQYRVLRRARARYRGHDRYPRQRKPRAIAELIGAVIRHRGLTEEFRQQLVCLYWPEIAGERIASKAFPMAFSAGVLHASAISSPWVHEMQFFRAQLIAQINDWIDANRAWLGPPPLVTNIRFALQIQPRERLVDPEHARQLRLRHLRRSRPRETVPPVVSDAEREAIRRETSTIVDAELRAVIEAVRMKWSR